MPPEVAAEIDCRLLPDQDHDEFIALLRSVINDPGVRIEKIMGFSPAVSTTDTDLYRAIETVVKKHYPGSQVIPAVSTGFTDSHFTRDLGIASYGFDPAVVPESEKDRMHGNDERINVEAFKRGLSDHLVIIQTVVYD